MSNLSKLDVEDDLRSEYDLKTLNLKPNRFVSQSAADVRSIVLDPDVAMFYSSAATINGLLRALIPVFEKQAVATMSETDETRAGQTEPVPTATLPPTPIEA